MSTSRIAASRLVLSALVSLSACAGAKKGPAAGDGSASGDTAATGAPAPTGAVERPDNESHVVDFEPEELERLKLMGAEVAKDLAEGQAAANAGDWPKAIVAYEKAMALDEDNPHIHAALGWAQFNTEAYDPAKENLYAALRHERDGDRRADYLYRLGRVEEAQGDLVSAKRHYDHSLRLKSNPDAQERDDSLAAKVAELCKGNKCVKPDYPDLNAACAAMLERVHKQLHLKPHEADGAFTCNPDNARRVAIKGAEASEAVLLKISGEHGMVEEEEYDLLAHIEGGWHWVGTMLDIENPHKDGIFRAGKVLGFEARELVPELPGEEILLHVELGESDSDLDDNIVYHDEHEAYVVCGLQNGHHNCHEIPVRELYEAEALDVNYPAKGRVEKTVYEATATFDGKGKVTVAGEGDIPSDYKGTHTIMSLPEPHGFVFLHED
jgi:tetratricopeptide (TPR) repeat protein